MITEGELGLLIIGACVLVALAGWFGCDLVFDLLDAIVDGLGALLGGDDDE